MQVTKEWVVANKSRLAGADLTDANLTGVDLAGASLTGANLTGANLTGAKLTGAKLTGANLTDTNLAGADLTYTYLTGSNLAGADLTGADLTGTDLTYADLTGADLTGVIGLGTKEEEVAFAKRLLTVITSGEGDLEMDELHTNCSAHCIIGWWLFWNNSEVVAAASRAIPTLSQYYFASNSDALAALERVAAGEKSVFG